MITKKEAKRVHRQIAIEVEKKEQLNEWYQDRNHIINELRSDYIFLDHNCKNLEVVKKSRADNMKYLKDINNKIYKLLKILDQEPPVL